MLEPLKLTVVVLLGALLVLSGNPRSLSAADPVYMDQPFAIVAIAGLDRVQDDLTRLGEVSGNLQPLNQFRALQEQLGKLPGVDRSRAVGGVLVLHRKKLELPAAVVLLPVANGEQFVGDLKKKLRVVQSIEKGKWRINLPNLTLYVYLQDNYLLISQNRPTLNLITTELLEVVNANTQQNDLYVTLDLDGMSPPLRERIVSGINIDLDKELGRKPNETDEALRLRLQLVELVRSVVMQIVTETKSLKAELNVETDIQFHLDWQARPRTALAHALNSLPLEQNQEFITPREDQALQIQFGVNVPESFQKVIGEVFKSAREHLRQEIGPKLAEADRGPVTGAFDALRQTLQAGKLAGSISLLETASSEMVMLGGVRILGEELLATSLATILPYTRESEDILEVEMDVLKSDSMKLHRLRGKEQRTEDKRMYGADASLFVGTGYDAFWLAVGGSATPSMLTAAISREHQSAPPLFGLDFSLDPWMRLEEKRHSEDPQAMSQRDLEKLQRMRRALPDHKEDRVTLDVFSRPDGIRAKLNAEAGYLKLFGLSLNRPEDATP